MARTRTTDAKLAAAAQRAQAMQLRLAGATYDAIAESCHYSSKQAAHRAVKAALRDVLREPAEELRSLEVERLDRIQRALWPQALLGNQGAVDRVLKIMERRAKLLGLDAPVRSELTGKDGAPVAISGTVTAYAINADDADSIFTILAEAGAFAAQPADAAPDPLHPGAPDGDAGGVPAVAAP